MERLAKHERHSMDAMACIRHACATAHHLHAPRGLAPTSPQSWHLCQPMQWSSNALVRSHTPGSTKNNRRCAIALYACENCEPQGQRGIKQMQTLCLRAATTQPQQCHPQSHHLQAHPLTHPTPASCPQPRAASAPNLVLTTSRTPLSFWPRPAVLRPFVPEGSVTIEPQASHKRYTKLVCALSCTPPGHCRT